MGGGLQLDEATVMGKHSFYKVKHSTPKACNEHIKPTALRASVTSF